MSIGGPGGHPMLLLKFEDVRSPGSQPIERCWYFCPREGDFVELRGEPTPDNEYGELLLTGNVTKVMWTDDFVVVDVG